MTTVTELDILIFLCAKHERKYGAAPNKPSFLLGEGVVHADRGARMISRTTKEAHECWPMQIVLLRVPQKPSLKRALAQKRNKDRSRGGLEALYFAQRSC